MDNIKKLITKIFNPLLISRFIAKNIDLLIGQIGGMLVIIIGSNHNIQLDVVWVSLFMAFITIVLEALLLYYFNVTPGKFFMGLRVIPKSLPDSFKRSFSCYFRALGVGIPVLGLGFSLGYYLLGINGKKIPWDEYAQVEQNKKNFVIGIVSALSVNLILLALFSFIDLKKHDDLPLKHTKSGVLETIVDYPGFEDVTKPSEQLNEEEESIIDVWNTACRLGALGVFQRYQGSLVEQNIIIISNTCERGIKEINTDDEIETIYLKACGYGIGVGSALIFKENIEISPLYTEGAQLLKEICLPSLEQDSN